MSLDNDGGPAFPWGEHGTHLGGMTIRDVFAAKTLEGAAVHIYEEYRSGGAADRVALSLAEVAYMMADAMLKAREK